MIPDYSQIKPEVIATLQRYVEDGVPTGGFLRAVLENNLTESFGRADAENCRALFHICAYVYNEMPYGCHGSPEKVSDWLQAKQKEREESWQKQSESGS